MDAMVLHVLLIKRLECFPFAFEIKKKIHVTKLTEIVIKDSYTDLAKMFTVRKCI